MVTGNQFHNSLNPLCIQLIEDIIQEEQRKCIGTRALQESKLSQFQGYHESFVLPLTSLSLHRIITQQKLQIITVNTMQRIPYSTILKPVALDNIQQRTSLAMRNIVKTDLLLIARNLLINLLKQRNQFVNESLPFPVQQFTITRHLLFPKFQQRNIRLLLHFQQSISLLQSLIIVG